MKNKVRLGTVFLIFNSSFLIKFYAFFRFSATLSQFTTFQNAVM